MAEEDPQQEEIKIDPEDPSYQLEEHILFRRNQQALTKNLKKICQENLSQFSPIMNGTTYAFTTLTLSNKGLRAINETISDYPHLRKIELSNNQLSEISYLQKLVFLNSLDLSRNLLQDSKFLSNQSYFPYLKHLNLSNNKLTYLPAVGLQRIKHLNLNSNAIALLDQFDGHPTLQILELRGNQISHLKGLSQMKSLKELYLADNKISKLDGLDKLPSLEKLHLRKNKFIEIKEFPNLSTIKYLNLRENQIAKVDSISGINKNVQILNLLANPVSEELADNTKKEVWMRYRNYQKINKNEVTPQERQEFDKEYKEKLAEIQKERLEREAADKEAREQAEREAAEKAVE